MQTVTVLRILSRNIILIKIRESNDHLENKHNQAVDHKSSRTQPDVPGRVEDILSFSEVVACDDCFEYNFFLIIKENLRIEK